MELVDGDAKSPTLISNVEVMEMLGKSIADREEKEKKRNKNRKNNNNRRYDSRFRHRDWVEDEVFRYLQSTPCVKLDPNKREEFHSKLKGNKKLRRTTTSTTTTTAGAVPMDIETNNNNDKQPSSSSSSSAETTGFDLTEAEALQIMNMMPTEPVEIHLMVDDLQSRMSEERQEEFLAFVGSYCTGSAHDYQQQQQQQQPMNDSNHNQKFGGRQENGTKPSSTAHHTTAVRVKQEAKESAII